MKTTRKIQTHRCDKCRRFVDFPSTCLHCGKEYCADCAPKLGIRYTVKVFGSRSDDGYYCHKCDMDLRSRINNALPPDPVHRAFVNLHYFKFSYHDTIRELTQKGKNLEDALEVIRQEQGK